MSHCTTIDQAVLERTKMDKVLPKIVKRGDEQGKAFAQKVLANAAAVSKQKSLDSKSSKSVDHKDVAERKTQVGSKSSSDASSGVKYSQSSGEAGPQSLKKVMTATTPVPSNSTAATAKAGSGCVQKAFCAGP